MSAMPYPCCTTTSLRSPQSVHCMAWMWGGSQCDGDREYVSFPLRRCSVCSVTSTPLQWPRRVSPHFPFRCSQVVCSTPPHAAGYCGFLHSQQRPGLLQQHACVLHFLQRPFTAVHFSNSWDCTQVGRQCQYSVMDSSPPLNWKLSVQPLCCGVRHAGEQCPVRWCVSDNVSHRHGRCTHRRCLWM